MNAVRRWPSAGRPGQPDRRDRRGRRGLTLTEVLIAFFVLLVGVVSVIALFPLGVRNVQDAVMDTRNALVGMEAAHEFLALGWADDPYLIHPPHRGITGLAGSQDPGTGAGSTSPSGGDPRGIDPATIPPYTGTRPGFAAAGWNNVFCTIMNFDGTAPPRATGAAGAFRTPPQRMHPLADTSFPVFIDPVLANSREFQSDGTAAATAANPVYKRVAIAADLGTYRTMAPFTRTSSFGTGTDNGLNDLVIHSVSEIQYSPAGTTATGLATPSPRDHALRARLGSLDQVHFESGGPAVPLNPSRTASLPGWRYLVAGDSGSPTAPTASSNPLLPPGYRGAGTGEYPTAMRNNDFSFAFVVHPRRLEDNLAATPFPNDTAPVPALPFRVPRYGQVGLGDMQVLCFHKRSTTRGYQLVRGCFFANSAVATLCWDTTLADPPQIRKGQWLMEATLGPGKTDAIANTTFPDIPINGPVAGSVKYRHAIAFHRVASVEDPRAVTDGNTYMYQVVTLEQPVPSGGINGYPITHVLGDGRAVPDIYDRDAATRLTFDGTTALPTTIADDATTVWTPVVLLDGLKEVFTVAK